MPISDNLLTSVKKLITPDFIERSSDLLGESPSKLQSGFMATIPALFKGIMDKGSTQEGARGLLNLIKEDDYESGVPTNYLDHLSGGKNTEHFLTKGHDAINHIFGDRLDSVVEKSSGILGLNGSSFKRLMAIAAPLVMGVLGSKVKQQGLNASSFMSFLSQQRNNIKPETVEYTSKVPKTEPIEYNPNTQVDQGYEKNRNWLPLGALALLLLGGFVFLKNRTRPEVVQPESETQEQAGTAAPVTEPPAPAVPEQPAVKQPTAEKPKISEQVSAFLENGSDAELPKRFTFDNLNFNSGALSLTEKSNETVNEIAAALTSHPTAIVRLESFTDNVGNSVANRRLSEGRAETVKKALIARGVNGKRIRTVGMGESHPLASNDTRQGREENRRTELIIVKR